MGPLAKNVAFAVLFLLFGLTAFAYVKAMQRWRGRLFQAAASSSEEEWRQFRTSDEYRELRSKAQRPIWIATLLFGALYLIMKI